MIFIFIILFKEMGNPCSRIQSAYQFLKTAEDISARDSSYTLNSTKTTATPFYIAVFEGNSLTIQT